MRSNLSYLSDTGTLPDATFVKVFPGWNVWTVAQSDDLDFSPMMVGLDADRRLRIWVEEQIREKAPEAVVADPLALKGSQVEILPAEPKGLKALLVKEGVPGDEALHIKFPAKLRTVRFFNRGSESRLVWPHDNNYLLDTIFVQEPTAEVFKGGSPGTIIDNAGKQVSETVSSGLKPLLVPALIVGALILAVSFTEVKERTRNAYRRIKNER